MLINKKTLEYLAELSRIELDKKHEEKMITDLQNILGHFDELKEINTEGVEPLAGGTDGINVFRGDDTLSTKYQVSSIKNLTEAFPDEENGFLKVPPVFE